MKPSEALRLADMIEQTIPSKYHQHEAAAELRRLHEANQAMLEALRWIDKRCPTHFVNEPLHGMHREMAHDAGVCARAAIAKGEQQ